MRYIIVIGFMVLTISKMGLGVGVGGEEEEEANRPIDVLIYTHPGSNSIQVGYKEDQTLLKGSNPLPFTTSDAQLSINAYMLL